MIRGWVDRRRLPVIDMPIGGTDWPAVIDTGFGGDLELPAALFGTLQPRFIGYSRSQLAAGATVTEGLYDVGLAFDQRVVTAEATFVAGREILIGGRLLAEHRLEVNYVTGEVRLERVAEPPDGW